MEKAMHREMREVVQDRFSFSGGFPRGGFIRNDDVPQRDWRAMTPARRRGGEGQDIRGLVVAAPSSIERANEAIVGQQNGDLGVGGLRHRRHGMPERASRRR